MSILTVRATTITLGGILIDAYTADEQLLDGSWVNYLSGNGLANSIGLENSTTIQSRLPQALKAMLGNDLTTMQKGRFLNKSGAFSQMTLWTSARGSLSSSFSLVTTED
jgi:hypothetical protein